MFKNFNTLDFCPLCTNYMFKSNEVFFSYLISARACTHAVLILAQQSTAGAIWIAEVTPTAPENKRNNTKSAQLNRQSLTLVQVTDAVVNGN